MRILENPEFRVEAAAINDIVNYEGGRLVADTDRAAVVELPNGLRKCVFSSFESLIDYRPKGELCLMNMPLDAPEKLGFSAEPCVTYAYFLPMPPTAPTVDIRRLAPSLAQTLANEYSYKGGGYTADEMRELMKDKGIFGAIEGGRLAGFIGRHHDGNMGLLKVFDGFRRRGIGAELERFMITYIMTFGRVPICDVYVDNAPSIRLQQKLGLTPAKGYTFWVDI